jgi:hypothetical protein
VVGVRTSDDQCSPRMTRTRRKQIGVQSENKGQLALNMVPNPTVLVQKPETPESDGTDAGGAVRSNPVQIWSRHPRASNCRNRSAAATRHST